MDWDLHIRDHFSVVVESKNPLVWLGWWNIVFYNHREDCCQMHIRCPKLYYVFRAKFSCPSIGWLWLYNFNSMPTSNKEDESLPPFKFKTLIMTVLEMLDSRSLPLTLHMSLVQLITQTPPLLTKEAGRAWKKRTSFCNFWSYHKSCLRDSCSLILYRDQNG